MNNNYITKKVFWIVIPLILTAFLAIVGYVVGRQDKLTETFNHNVTEIKTDISSMKVDISWIVKTLDTK